MKKMGGGGGGGGWEGRGEVGGEGMRGSIITPGKG
jgi:hypothetical protein